MSVCDKEIMFIFSTNVLQSHKYMRNVILKSNITKKQKKWIQLG